MLTRMILPAMTILSAGFLLFSAAAYDPVFEHYRRVCIHPGSSLALESIKGSGINLENIEGSPRSGYVLEVNGHELTVLKRLGIRYEVLVEDLRAYYQQRVAERAAKTAVPFVEPVHFKYGSMGGLYTLDEIRRDLDSMRLLFPNLVSVRDSIGASWQNRALWAVKISDNVSTNESATEPAVYYDALHHAREGGSMEVLLYFMWWLLENYGSDPTATALVNGRELFFVPAVNPDGYEYNRRTSPAGGGMWRKNMRDNNNNGLFDAASDGVDLNRNYSYLFGNDGPSNWVDETYRGPTAFSEPETRAVRDYTARIRPTLAFSMHTYGERYNTPFGGTDTPPAWDVYAGFSMEFLPAAGAYLFGNTKAMLDYYSCGTTRDYLHVSGTYAWTPEYGSTAQGGFWPLRAEILPVVRENLYPMQYIAWAAGAFARFESAEMAGSGFAVQGDTALVMVTVRNLGLTKTAEQVTVTMSTSYTSATVVDATRDFGPIDKRTSKNNRAAPFRVFIGSTAAFQDQVPLIISVRQQGVETSRDTFAMTIGTAAVLFSDSAELGSSRWVSAGAAGGSRWDTTSVGAWRGSCSFADSRYGNTLNRTSSTLTTAAPISLVNTTSPYLEFFARWSIQKNIDYVRVQISADNGSTWQTPVGNYTAAVAGAQGYTGNRNWVRERVSLTPYRGGSVRIRFLSVADSIVSGDGFYFDDLRIVDYRPVISGTVFASPPEAAPVFSICRGGDNKIIFSGPVSGNAECQLILYDLQSRILLRQTGTVQGKRMSVTVLSDRIGPQPVFAVVRMNGRTILQKLLVFNKDS